MILYDRVEVSTVSKREIILSHFYFYVLITICVTDLIKHVEKPLGKNVAESSVLVLVMCIAL